MSFTTIQQIHQLLEDKKNILITFRKDNTGDAISSAIALLLFLEKMSKPVDVICDGFELPKNLSFLKKSDQIKDSFSYLQKFIMTLNVEKTGIQELSYDVKNQNLRIFVTPKQGSISKEDITTAQSDFKYDLIFTLNTQDLESLGTIYDNNTDLFYKTPIINIDNQPANERFGQINLIDLTASSSAEILFDLMKKLAEEYICEEVATALLSGVISETKSFRSDSVKPYTLSIASKLISMGADREKIVNNLYKTRTIPMLKLWGHTLTHMQHDNSIGLVWSTITRDDFVRCGAKETDLKDIIDELINNSPEAKITLLLHEHAGNDGHKIHGLLNTNKNYDAKTLVERYNAKGTKDNASFIITEKTLKEAEHEVVQHLKTSLLTPQ